MPRQKKEINWDIVEKKMEAGCTAKEIAGSVGLCLDTFYDKVKLEYGKGFADIAERSYAAGDGNLKFTQYMKALSGNSHMLILLGKERLGQGKDQVVQAPLQEIVDLRHENMFLKDHIMKLEANAHQSQTE